MANTNITPADQYYDPHGPSAILETQRKKASKVKGAPLGERPPGKIFSLEELLVATTSPTAVKRQKDPEELQREVEWLNHLIDREEQIYGRDQANITEEQRLKTEKQLKETEYKLQKLIDIVQQAQGKVKNEMHKLKEDSYEKNEKIENLCNLLKDKDSQIQLLRKNSVSMQEFTELQGRYDHLAKTIEEDTAEVDTINSQLQEKLKLAATALREEKQKNVEVTQLLNDERSNMRKLLEEYAQRDVETKKLQLALQHAQGSRLELVKNAIKDNAVHTVTDKGADQLQLQVKELELELREANLKQVATENKTAQLIAQLRDKGIVTSSGIVNMADERKKYQLLADTVAQLQEENKILRQHLETAGAEASKSPAPSNRPLTKEDLQNETVQKLLKIIQKLKDERDRYQEAATGQKKAGSGINGFGTTRRGTVSPASAGFLSNRSTGSLIGSGNSSPTGSNFTSPASSRTVSSSSLFSPPMSPIASVSKSPKEQ